MKQPQDTINNSIQSGGSKQRVKLLKQPVYIADPSMIVRVKFTRKVTSLLICDIIPHRGYSGYNEDLTSKNIRLNNYQIIILTWRLKQMSTKTLEITINDAKNIGSIFCLEWFKMQNLDSDGDKIAVDYPIYQYSVSFTIITDEYGSTRETRSVFSSLAEYTEYRNQLLRQCENVVKLEYKSSLMKNYWQLSYTSERFREFADAWNGV